MNRRALLKLLSAALAAGCAAVVAVPGLSYLVSAVRRRAPGGAVVRRVARLGDLPVGQPVEAPVIAGRRDAWTLYPEETIGRLWLVRRSDDSTPPGESKVEAYTSVCPHLGCALQLTAAKKGFVCPCHRATFDLSGARTEQPGQTNHSPRDMDSLTCRVVEDAQTGEWWVEVEHQKFQRGLTRKVAAV